MRKSSIIHGELMRALTSLRHTDLFAVSDSGLPVPVDVPVIDLGVVYGVPAFLRVLDPIREEVAVEAAWGSDLVETVNPAMCSALVDRLPLELIDHDDFKARIGDCRFVVRTGEATPYANVILRAGVPWL